MALLKAPTIQRAATEHARTTATASDPGRAFGPLPMVLKRKPVHGGKPRAPKRSGAEGRSQLRNSASGRLRARVVFPTRRTPEATRWGWVAQSASMRESQRVPRIRKPDFTLGRAKPHAGQQTRFATRDRLQPASRGGIRGQAGALRSMAVRLPGACLSACSARWIHATSLRRFSTRYPSSLHVRFPV
jgi:hypothetical protein